MTISASANAGSSTTQSNCFRDTSELFLLSIPFTFGVPQIVPVAMEASAVGQGYPFFQTWGSESLDHIQFFDSAGNPLSNVTYTLVSVPEPSAWSLLSIGLVCFLALPIRRMRFVGRTQMFRIFVFLTSTLGVASAAAFSAIATCNGVTTTGTTSASCNDNGAMASASALGISAQAQAITGAVQPGSPLNSAFASANFSDNYFFTVSGGTGQGSFYPCFEGGGNGTAREQGTFDGVSFEEDGSPGGGSNCFGTAADLFPLSKPLTFGATQVVPVQIAVSVMAGDPFFDVSAGIGLDTIVFFDASGNPLPNATYTLVSASVPEPSAWSLLSIGLMFFVVVRIYLRQSSAANSA